MTQNQVERLIVKYLKNEADLEELESLVLLLNNPDYEQLFRELIRTNYAIDYTMNTYDTSQVKKDLLRKIRQDKMYSIKFRKQAFLKYAAIAILFVGLAYLYQEGTFSGQPAEQIIPKEEAITLELENGKVEIMNILSSKDVRDIQGKLIGKQNKTQLAYSKDAMIETLIYNTLNVPYGKRFELILSDGTKVKLNAGTSLKYPVKFIKGHDRRVYLTGEAYFDVAKDTKHPFIVNAEELNVEVMGTAFNLSAYPEDNTTDVVLVEGSVGLYIQGDTMKNVTSLSPGIKATLDRNLKSIKTEEVNTNLYTGWMQGGLIFRNASFKNIVKKLERHYNIEIIINNEELGNEVFNASFKQETIDKVLSYFNDSYDIDYTIKENTIYIN